MASPNEIPNLRTLLGQRRGGGTRGRGRDRGGFESSNAENDQARDNAVKGTDQDAAGSRVSCVELGYLQDPYAKLFATRQTVRRLPLLNRGTYVRTSAIDYLVAKFLETEPSSMKQIISLGAGTDTRYFRLLDLYPSARLVYHEIDFASNTVSKIAAIQRYPLLHKRLEHMPDDTNVYHSRAYNIHALDLRSLATPSGDMPLPVLPNLDPNLPTLILSEMCLVYLQPSVVHTIIQSLLNHYIQPATPASLILYEPILPQDAFGRTMISNLQTRNIHLPTLTSYPELSDQRARLHSYGFKTGARAVDTSFLWRNWISDEEKERVGSLEFLDELEELELLLRHYCVAWGWKDGDADLFRKAWGEVRED